MSKQMQAAQQAERASDLRKAGNASNPARADSGLLRAQQGLARVVAAFIVLSAMVLTFEGTMTFVQNHGALGWRGALIAAMNDLAVLVGILWPEKPLQAIALFCSAFTLWANLSHAAPGPAGLAVALVAPALAILMVGAVEWLIRRAGHEPVDEPVSQTSEPSLSREPVLAQVGGSCTPIGSLGLKVVSREGSLREPYEPVHEPLHLVGEPVWDRGAVLRLIADEGLSTAEAVARTGVSKATINRWKREAA